MVPVVALLRRANRNLVAMYGPVDLDHPLDAIHVSGGSTAGVNALNQSTGIQPLVQMIVKNGVKRPSFVFTHNLTRNQWDALGHGPLNPECSIDFEAKHLIGLPLAPPPVSSIVPFEDHETLWRVWWTGLCYLSTHIKPRLTVYQHLLA